MPREHTFVVFDEYLPKSVNGSANAIFTGSQFNAQMGRANQIGIHAVLDNLTVDTSANRNLFIFIEESNDGRNWIERANPANDYNTNNADMTLAVPITAVAPIQMLFTDACQGLSKGASANFTTGPLLGLVRLRIFFDGAGTNGPAGHLRIHVTQRDR